MARRDADFPVLTGNKVPGVLLCAFKFVEGIHLIQGRRNLHTVRFSTGDKLLNADRIKHLEGTELPTEAPLHTVVDVDNIVGNLGNPVDRIDQGITQVAPSELGSLVVA